jgi:hypothetical protein
MLKIETLFVEQLVLMAFLAYAMHKCLSLFYYFTHFLAKSYIWLYLRNFGCA